MSDVGGLEGLAGQIQRGCALLEAEDRDLSQIRAGLEEAAAAARTLAEVDSVLPAEQFAALEGLLVRTLRQLPQLQAAEGDVLIALTDAASTPLDPVGVRALAEARDRCLTAATDLQAGLARAYERRLAPV